MFSLCLCYRKPIDCIGSETEILNSGSALEYIYRILLLFLVLYGCKATEQYDPFAEKKWSHLFVTLSLLKIN